VGGDRETLPLHESRRAEAGGAPHANLGETHPGAASREQYRSIGKLPPEKRQDLRQQWAEYQALPPTEKRVFDVPPTFDPRAKRKPRAGTKPQTAKPKTNPSLP